MKMVALAVLVASLAGTVTAHAQTAEEAVAYVFLGVAEGAKIVRGQTTMTWTETATSPATFAGDVDISGKSYKIGFTVKGIDDCHYEITLDGPPQLVRGGSALYARVDLHDVGEVTIVGDALHVAIKGTGFCETGTKNPTCMVIDTTDLYGGVDAARHKAAGEFLKSEVCKAATQ